MTDARVRLFWHRAGPLTGLAGLVAITAAQGCGGGNNGAGGSGGTSSHSGTTTTTTATTGTGGMTTGTGGSGGGSPFMGSVSSAANAATALDATPNPAGTTLFFTSVSPVTALPGVYTAPADGSVPTPVLLAGGDPFTAPFGIATSTDGKTLYIADPGAIASMTDHGAIFSMPIAGAVPAIVSGTATYEPRNLEVAQVSGADVIFFTGHDPMGSVGVFSIPAAGGNVTKVLEGAPFDDPSGIAVAADGSVYVADTTSSSVHRAVIYKVSGGAATAVASDLYVGYPCGVALSKDEKSLFLSALDPVKHTDVLLEFDLSTNMQTMSISTNVSAFTEAAGLHRAKDADVFAWADSNAGASNGQVFVVK